MGGLVGWGTTAGCPIRESSGHIRPRADLPASVMAICLCLLEGLALSDGERRVERSLARLGRVPAMGGLAGKEGELAGRTPR